MRPVKGQILRLDPGRLPSPGADRAGLHPGQRGLPGAAGEGREVVVGATVEELGFDGRVTAGGVYELLRDARAVLPMTRSTAGRDLGRLRPGTPDNAPMLGGCALAGLVLATGHYRNGVLLTPITADVIADAVAHRRRCPRWRPVHPGPLRTGRRGGRDDHLRQRRSRETVPAPVPAVATCSTCGAGYGRRRAGIAVAVDGAVVPRAEHADHRLHDGARVEIVTAVQGG